MDRYALKKSNYFSLVRSFPEQWLPSQIGSFSKFVKLGLLQMLVWVSIPVGLSERGPSLPDSHARWPEQQTNISSNFHLFVRESFHHEIGLPVRPLRRLNKSGAGSATNCHLYDCNLTLRHFSNVTIPSELFERGERTEGQCWWFAAAQLHVRVATTGLWFDHGRQWLSRRIQLKIISPDRQIISV